MLQAALVLFRFYRDLAPALAKEYGIAYQAGLERMMIGHLEELGAAGLGSAPAKVHS
jgi:hypothetical protein